ncbi:MAG: translation elongation factor Ts [Opitutales bacterium]
MAQITASMVAELRAKTGGGLMDCKKALSESDGDFEEAITLLKKRGQASAAKKAGRSASEGLVESYIHLGGKVGVLLELRCESDFVAKNDMFKALARDICMHIAAAAPVCVRREEVPEHLIEKEKEVARGQAEGKPPQAVEKIVEGKINKWMSTICLLDQPFVKNADQTIQELLTEQIAKIGENIMVARFARFQLGEDE